jgi:hypothetical protein
LSLGLNRSHTISSIANYNIASLSPKKIEIKKSKVKIVLFHAIASFGCLGYFLAELSGVLI